MATHTTLSRLSDGTLHRNFSTDTAFDKHRHGPWDARSCKYPSGVGLVERTNEYGSRVWGQAPPTTPPGNWAAA